ncbi:hypothetical protein [Brucella pituitosa]|uniref:hypothetical protein n=1 Tax=Brucella pituitosa TaxID=571256 RepID=UPI0013E3AD84|nr:hypothetical protein [Brucella pituitosa]
MHQPAYDIEFGEIIRWLRQHGLILQSDLEGNTELSTRAERIDRKRCREAEQTND